jgi:hypothetical protein
VSETAKSNKESELTSENMTGILGSVRFYNSINKISVSEEYNNVR